MEDNAHTSRFSQCANLRTDIAVANNAQRFAARLVSALCSFVPESLMHACIFLGDTAQQQDGFTQYQFGHRAGVREWSIEHRDTTQQCSIQIHLVRTDAEAAYSTDLRKSLKQ